MKWIYFDKISELKERWWGSHGLPKYGEEVLILKDDDKVEFLVWGALIPIREGLKYFKAWCRIELPEKKRWRPAKCEPYFYICSDGIIDSNNNRGPNSLEDRRSYSGVYKTKEEAEEMAQKIKDFVTKEIGEA